MKLVRYVVVLAAVLALMPASATVRVYDAARMGLRPDSRADASAAVQRMIAKARRECREGDTVVLRFGKGRYDFYESGAVSRNYFISNHDQTQPKRVGMALEGFANLTVEGCGARFVCHGRMLPVALTGGENCRLKDFEIDFEQPHIAQVRIVGNDPDRGITFLPDSGVEWRVTADSLFEYSGEGWTIRPRSGIAFNADNHHIIYRTADVALPLKGV